MNYSELEMEARGNAEILVLVYHITKRHIRHEHFHCQSELHILLVHVPTYDTVFLPKLRTLALHN
jgi:hypothetical protein